MQKIKEKLATWKDGKSFLEHLTQLYSGSIEEREDTEYFHADNLEVSVHYDLREYSFIVIKTADEELMQEIRTVLQKFQLYTTK